MINQGICTKGSIKTIGKLSFCTCGKPNCLLGKGGFGEVYRGKFDGQVEVAVKRVDKFRTKVETDILRKADCHPNILRFFITEEKNQSKYIATELCAGNLDDLIKKRYKGPSVGYDQRIILRQIVSGLEHLHKMKIIHRDIKPENILVSFKNGYIPPLMKLTDFGLSRTALVNHFRVLIPNDGDDGIRVGTEGWMAPEMYENVKITYSIDIFPLGCVFAFTLNDGHHPFDIEPPNENESKNDTRVRIKERSIRIERKQPMILTEEQLREGDRIAYKLIESMLNPDPKSRPSTSKVIQHEYFKLSGINIIRSVHQPLHIRTTVRDAQKEEDFLELCSREQMDDNAIDRFNELVMDGAVYCNCTNEEGYSPLMLLCRNNTQSDSLYRSIEMLLKRAEIDVNQTDKYGDNCLMKLCWNSPSQSIVEIAELLIANGADVNQKDQYGDNALMLLCWNSTNNRMVQVAELLITKGTDINHEDNYGRNAFYYLQMNSNIKNLNRESRERLQLFFSNPQPSRCLIM